MSTQTGIVSSFNSKKLWTVPSKEQYLPAYFKKICDLYLKEANPRRLFPVEVSNKYVFTFYFMMRIRVLRGQLNN